MRTLRGSQHPRCTELEHSASGAGSGNISR
jgi:hypothetical protein